MVIHAAALKHVDVAEYNPFEAVLTNVVGTQNVIKAAIHQGVDKVLSVSSDKAVNPTNLYGATKLCADKLIESAGSYAGKNGTRFSTIRFGNFWGSRGSVVPYFKNLLLNGAKHLPIHDYKMTRFFIQTEDAAMRVVEALRIMKGKEIFCPKMSAVRIKDVAKKIAPTLPTKETGAKRGEKIHEEMLTDAEVQHTYAIKNFYIIDPSGNGTGKKVSQNFRYSSELFCDGNFF
jgi:UDP-N-acetylglucosamine 4,6-dehydratase